MGIGIISIASLYQQPQVIGETVVPEASPTTPVPAVIPTPAYPASIEFTVKSTTLTDGHYTVFTNAGQTLYMPDFSSWNSLLPHNSYTATISGTEPNGAYDAGSVTRGFSLVAVYAITRGIQVSPYPYIVEFTVLSKEVKNGHYAVRTTTGKKLYVQDVDSWNSLVPGNTCSATITGIETGNVFVIGSVLVISRDTARGSSESEYPPEGSDDAMLQIETPRALSSQDSLTSNPGGAHSVPRVLIPDL